MHLRASAMLWMGLFLLSAAPRSAPAGGAIADDGPAATITNIEGTTTGLTIVGRGFGAQQGSVRCLPAQAQRVVAWSDTRVSVEWVTRVPRGALQVKLYASAPVRELASGDCQLPLAEIGSVHTVNRRWGTVDMPALLIAGTGFGSEQGSVKLGQTVVDRERVLGWRNTEVAVVLDARAPIPDSGRITLLGPGGAEIVSNSSAPPPPRKPAKITKVEVTPKGLRILGIGFEEARGEVKCEPEVPLRVTEWANSAVEIEWLGRVPTGRISLRLISTADAMHEIASTDFAMPK